MTACAAELQSQPIWLPTTGVNNRDRRQLEERSDAGERRGNRWTGGGLWIDFISSIRVTHPPTITLPDTKSLLKSFSPILNPYTLICSFAAEVSRRGDWKRCDGCVCTRMDVCVCEREREGERRISAVTVLFSCFSHNGGQNYCKWESWPQLPLQRLLGMPPPTWTHRQQMHTKADENRRFITSSPVHSPHSTRQLPT